MVLSALTRVLSAHLCSLVLSVSAGTTPVICIESE